MIVDAFVLMFLELVLMPPEKVKTVLPAVLIPCELVLMRAEWVLMSAEYVDMVVLIPAELVEIFVFSVPMNAD